MHLKQLLNQGRAELHRGFFIRDYVGGVCAVRPRWGSASLLRSLGRSLSGNAGAGFGFSCLANFGWRQNEPNTLRPLPRLQLNKELYVGKPNLSW